LHSLQQTVVTSQVDLLATNIEELWPLGQIEGWDRRLGVRDLSEAKADAIKVAAAVV
jgi:hypothetical protein